MLAEPWRLAFVNMQLDQGRPIGGFAYDSTPPGNWDYLNIRDMLVPEPLDGAIDLPSAGPLRVPGSPLGEDLFVCPGLVVLGADYYEGELHRS